MRHGEVVISPTTIIHHCIICFFRIVSCFLNLQHLLGVQSAGSTTSIAAAAAAATTNDQETFTQFDRDAYLAARRGDGADQQHQHPHHHSHHYSDYDDPNGCTLYLAPSSIPNGGLGMYTTVPYSPGETFFSELGIVVHDPHRRAIVDDDRPRLSAQYPWHASSLSFAAFDAHHAESYIPGIGMLANSHLGLVNTRLSEPWTIDRSRDGTDSRSREDSWTREDAGRGAHTPHGRVAFQAAAHVEAGAELFVSYGEEWFAAREATLGIVPRDEDFREANELLRSFAEAREDLHKTDEEEEEDSDQPHPSAAAYEELLRDALQKSHRLRAALPDNVHDVPAALDLGTARFSAKDSVQSMEWLEENGACLDNIVSGVSGIPQAGRGAFATRSIKEGERITTTPVITLDREQLLLWDSVEKMDDGGTVLELVGKQLLFNYCYGHTNSSLLLFPYAPTVNFINHGSIEDSNAELRWSTNPYHKADWLDESLEDIKLRMKTGLMFDVIATRDLRRGDEILIYYGEDWENSWNQHILEWPSPNNTEDSSDVDEATLPQMNVTDRLGLPTASDLNVIEKTPTVRTVEEQVDNPYPPYIMTLCRFKPPEECHAQNDIDGPCVSRWRIDYEETNIFPCDIKSRHFDSSSGMDWYSAWVKVDESSTHIVEYMQRQAILFSNRPYSKDQYAQGVFRHFIGLPDGLMPSQWMDLDFTSEYDDESEINSI